MGCGLYLFKYDFQIFLKEVKGEFRDTARHGNQFSFIELRMASMEMG